MLYQVIYSSRATSAMTVDSLQAILVDARAGNEARGITGALIYVDDVFLQVLEGDKDIVLSLMRSIAADSRHADVKVFHEAEVDHRVFGTWTMAYVDATADQLSAWAGLAGTSTVEGILQELGRDSTRVSRVAAGILRALVA